jgi:hypothetical protein
MSGTTTSVKDELRKITRMLRTGLDRGGTAVDLKKDIQEAIGAVKERDPNLLDEADRLRLCTCEAEYEYQNGKLKAAIDILTPIWNELKPRLETWGPANLLQSDGNTPALRQKLWACMHYVFFYYYELTGHNALAIKAFILIHKIICGELHKDNYTPFGTLSLYHYFIGQAYRAHRNFLKAEDHFLEAQKHLQNRIDGKRNDVRNGKPVDMGHEVDYQTVFSARVITGLSWLALHEGRLKHAETLLCTAQLHLAGTHQESLKLFIESIMWIAVLRRAPFGSEDQRNAIKELTRCFGEFDRMGDLAGCLRCATELARGHLDLVEFHSDNKALLNINVREAKQWMAHMDNPPDPRTRVHFHLLNTRRALQANDHDLAVDNVSDARDIAVAHKIWQECGVEIMVMESSYFFHRGDKLKAKGTIEKALWSIERRRRESRDSDQPHLPDPVLEGECYIRLGLLAVADGLVQEAKEHFDEWEKLSQFVENHYLHRLATMLHDDIKSTKQPYPATAYDFAVFDSTGIKQTLYERRNQFEKWMLQSVIDRWPPERRPLTLAKLGAVYGEEGEEVKKDTMRRRLESLGIQLPSTKRKTNKS